MSDVACVLIASAVLVGVFGPVTIYLYRRK